jgi:hypothetical protein
MRSSFKRSLLAVAASAAITFAGPLPDPPFADGGFVPPDSIVYKQEYNVWKLIVKDGVYQVKCDIKALIDLQLAYEPNDAPKVQAVEEAWTACHAKIDFKYGYYRDKLLLKGTPACLDQAGIDAIRAQVSSQITSLEGTVFCDGDAASPDPVTGFDIPDFKNEANGESAAAKVLLKVGTSVGKCYAKGVVYALQFGGAIPPEVVAKIQACIAKYETYGNAKMSDLDQTQKLPTCLPLATAQATVSAVSDFASSLTDDHWCASLSGAFVD